MEKNKKEKAIKLTKKGKARLFGKIAKYKKQRNWDKKIYIITYDIPEKRRRDRNILRTYLNKLAAARLQKSVYFTPYNPSKILNEFIQERELHGTIIVSCIGKDGFIGGKDIKSLTRKLYKIDRLNEKYEKLIKEFKESKGKNKLKFNFNYLSLLKEDPQLPFELLPENFKGEKAYQLYLKNLSI